MHAEYYITQTNTFEIMRHVPFVEEEAGVDKCEGGHRTLKAPGA